jgi:hypothetical protein
LHGHAEEPREQIESAGPDAIGSLFVFLHLTEGQAEMSGKSGLADAERFPSLPHSTANPDIDFTRRHRHDVSTRSLHAPTAAVFI